MWAWSAGTDGNKHTVHLKYFTMFQSVIVPTFQEGWHLPQLAAAPSSGLVC